MTKTLIAFAWPNFLRACPIQKVDVVYVRTVN